MSEKTEEPTQKKLDDAKLEGQVAQSRDVIRIMVCGVLFELSLGFAEQWRERLISGLDLAIARIDRDFQSALTEVLMAGLMDMVVLMLPVALLATIAVLIGSTMQIGLLFTPKALTPKFEKFNPAANAKQLFSGRSISQFLFNLIKSVLVACIVWKLTVPELPSMMLLSTGTLQDVWQGTLTLIAAIERGVMGAFLCMAALDYGMQHYFHRRSLRMSMEDMKQEYKESEGDPHVKGHRRQLAYELANSDPEETLLEANAVVVNPTHFAVALHYLPGETELPKVLLRGRDDEALSMIRRAKNAGIPVIRYPPLARALYATGREGRFVPSAQLAAVALLYRAIAELLGDGPADDEIPEINEEAAEAFLAHALRQGATVEGS